MDQPRKSRLWDPSTWKLRLKHRSQRSKKSNSSTTDEFYSINSSSPPRCSDVVEIQDQKDTFYRYSSSVYSDHDEVRSLLLRPKDDHTEDFNEYFMVSSQSSLSTLLSQTSPCSNPPSQQTDASQMAPNRRHSRPYTVSSGEWVLVPSSETPSLSSASRVLSLDDLTDVQRAYHFSAVLKIFAKVYAVAKILHVAFLAYGVELDTAETGLMYWIERSEMEIRTDSLAVLIENVENLYYALYSRVIIEMAGIELCALFKIDSRPVTTRKQFYLPDPNHLYRIFLACKDLLDAPSVCECLQETVVSQWEEGYLRRLAIKQAESGFNPDDLLGYRRYALSIISDRTCAYVKKWNNLIPFFDTIPAEVLTVLSEKYFTIMPRVVMEDDVPAAELPFIDLKATNFAQWEKDLIQDHRIATLAKLNGTKVGEERRDEPKIQLLTMVKYHKCICIASCFCALACTYDVERPCPCSERHLRLMLARRSRGPGRFDFTTRANTVARACWQGLASLKRSLPDEVVLVELNETFDIFELEIQKERWG
ncbi:hypothetical protein N7462_006690 [Penicillium macrosclerotiorum]|uniref:uncharacterized protein n=1 Tax=Penicillium macrosclerotiorum TaxID=303699 RepID=UPI002546CFAD|nr:uncharacterized protein N7462_006690 [Penicillium macrosclerotiorum]KAJ5683525.1 hypothetical protein N7462_006690 [Penicillium macrosclerotiorum]